MTERIATLIDAIKKEMDFERNQFENVLRNYSFKKKIDEGYLIWPLEITKKRYTIGEKIEVIFNTPAEKPSRIKEGAIVKLISKVKENEVLEWHANTSLVRKNEIRIILSDENLLTDDISDTGKYGIEIIYDEKPYRVMLSTLERLMKLPKSENQLLLQNLMKGNRNEETLDTLVGEDRIPTHLNTSQRLAIKQSLEARHYAIIHGPPGTGKTTTIVELLKTVSNVAGKILVCAPSNTAVDILADRINQRLLPVIRIGNITRIDDNVAELTLESMVKNHEDWSYIKKVKIEADEQERNASRYKRSYSEEDRKNRYELRKQARELRKWAKDLEYRLVDKLISDTKIICTTLIGSASRELEGINFDLAIIDEASQALEPECWVAIEKSKKVILVGDHKQLPPTIKSQEAKKSGLEITLLDRLSGIAFHSAMLTEQYRMNHKIMQWSNQQFYHGLLKANKQVAERVINSLEPVTFIDTAGTDFEEKINQDTQSYYNEGESFIILEYLIKHTEALQGQSIGIISPYAQQVKYIKNQIFEDQHTNGLDIEVNTIDGFQGEEKDVIFISLTRSNDKSNIGFLADERRINVAVTRARKCLVIVGDSATLGNHPLYGSLLAYIDKEGQYSSAWEYML